jgi:hypothetical protein
MKYFTNTTKRDKKAPSPNRVYLAPLRSAQIPPLAELRICWERYMKLHPIKG